MVPQTLRPHNPFEGLSVHGVRESFEHHPIRTAAAAAIFSASLLWGLKAAKKNGPIGAAVKGMIAVALMNKAKNVIVNGHGNGHAKAAYGAAGVHG